LGECANTGAYCMPTKPIHHLSPTTLIHAEKFGTLQDLHDVLSDFPIDIVAEFAGGKPEQILAFAGILPYFSLFNSIYFRSLTQGDGAIRVYPRQSGSKGTLEQDFAHVEDPKKYRDWYPPEQGNVRQGSIPKIGGWGSRRRWYVEQDWYMNEYHKFRRRLKENFQESQKDGRDDWNIPNTQEWMEENNLGVETALRFYMYFSGAPTGQIRRRAIQDGCAWVLGCVQNLPMQDAPFAAGLCQESEHSRPKIYDSQVAGDQVMCRIHNQWKTSNPLMDLGGILWCVFGD